jgi:hypothetical protein
MPNPTAMHATGLMYIGRNPRPVATTDAAGRFQLTLDVVDCLGPHSKEGWTLIWCGPEAAAFWSDYADALRTPGQPLRVAASHLRCYIVGRVPGIHARVVSLALAPRNAASQQTARTPESAPA